MLTTRFNHLDATFLNIDRRPETWSIHLEIRVSGHISTRRLSYALRAAIARHPLARARSQYFEGSATEYFWEFPSELDHLPLTVLDAKNEEDVVSIRNRFASLQVPLTLAPCFMVYLVHHAQGDYVMLNVPHTMADGLSAFRLLQSIVNIYADQPDPLPDINPLDVRDLLALAGSKSMTQLLERAKNLVGHLGKSAVPPARIAPQGVAAGDGNKRPGYGVELISLSKAESQLFLSKREKPATANDLMLAAVALTIRQWNDEQKQATGRIAMLMPVNLRPQAWWHEIVGNYTSYVSVSLNTADQTTLAHATQKVCEQTTAFKEAGTAGTLIDLLDVPKFLPAFLKAQLKELFPLFGKSLMETTWISNLGKLKDLPAMGEAGQITALHFTPPAPMPCSLSAGIAHMGDQLMIGLRYRKSQFDAKAVKRFSEMLKANLISPC